MSGEDNVKTIQAVYEAFGRGDVGFIRTKDKILEIYDAMSAAESTGIQYQSLLTPPPGNGPRHSAH